MNRKTNRNARCYCGSGKKYKNCCGQPGVKPKGAKSNVTGYILIAAAAVLIVLVFLLKFTGNTGSGSSSGPPGPAPPGKVWSPEHGHWHDI